MRVFVCAMNNKRSWMTKMKLVFTTYRYFFLLLCVLQAARSFPYGYVHRTYSEHIKNCSKMKWSSARYRRIEKKKRHGKRESYGIVLRWCASSVQCSRGGHIICTRAFPHRDESHLPAPVYNKNGNIGNRLEMLKWSLLNDEANKWREKSETEWAHTNSSVLCVCYSRSNISSLFFRILVDHTIEKGKSSHHFTRLYWSRCKFNRFIKCPWRCYRRMMFG